MWLDPKDYKDYDKLNPIIKLTKEIILDSNGYPIDIDAISDKLKGFVARYNEVDYEVNWNAITAYQRLDTFNFVAELIDPRFRDLYNEIKKIPSIAQVIINFVGGNTITPWHIDDDSVLEEWKKNNSGLYNENNSVIGCESITPTYQLMCGIWTTEFSGDDICLEFKDYGKKSWRANDIIAFDGTNEHMGWNKTSDVRVAMYFDVDRSAWKI